MNIRNTQKTNNLFKNQQTHEAESDNNKRVVITLIYKPIINNTHTHTQSYSYYIVYICTKSYL